MSVENVNTLTAIAEQKDDERQEAEAKEAQELLEQMQKTARKLRGKARLLQGA